MPKKAGMEKWKKKRRQEHMEQKLYRYNDAIISKSERDNEFTFVLSLFICN